MTAVLFIPTTADARLGRRVDFAAIARLFAETDEPRPRPDTGRAARIGLMILILLGALGDTLLVAHSDAVAKSLVAASPARSVGGAVTF